MYSNMMVGSNDIERSKKFYDATFTAMGGRDGSVDTKGRLVYVHNGGVFLVTKPIAGSHATAGTGSKIGFPLTPHPADSSHHAGIDPRRTANAQPTAAPQCSS